MEFNISIRVIPDDAYQLSEEQIEEIKENVFFNIIEKIARGYVEGMELEPYARICWDIFQKD